MRCFLLFDAWMPAGCRLASGLREHRLEGRGQGVLIYALEGGATVVVRPSGTEPKIKTYFTTKGKDLAEAQAKKDELAEAIKPILA